MSVDEKLKRNISDSEDEDFSLQVPAKKKRICLDSGSESESECVGKSMLKHGEESEATSDEDEPLKNNSENSKVHTSSSISDDKPLATKDKCSSIYSGGSKISSISFNDISQEDPSDDDDDDDEPINNIAKKKASKLKDKSKAMKHSSDSSEDEPIANKCRKSSENSNTQSITKELHSESDDEPLATFNKGKISQKPTSTNLEEAVNSASDSEEEILAVKNKSSKKKPTKNKNKIQPVSNGAKTSTDEDEPIGKMTKTLKDIGKKQNAVSSASDSEEEVLAVKNESSNKKPSERKNKNQSISNGAKSSSDEDEPIGKMAKTLKDIGKKQNAVSSASDSEEEFSAVKNKSSKRRSTERKNKNQSISNGAKSSSDEDEPIGKMAKTLKDIGKKQNAVSSASDSEEDFLAVKNKSSKKKPSERKNKNQSVSNGAITSSDEDEPIGKMTKTLKDIGKKQNKHHSCSSSDDEPLATKSTSNKKQKSPENSDLSSDDEEKPLSSITKASKQKVNKKISKDKTPPNGKIEHLKKYLRVAGIHVQSYDKLFENCKSVKSKVEKLLDLLHEKGLKGRPTIEKCKKLKKKIERKKEIAELDISNIIKSEGRPKRGSSGKIEKTLNTVNSPAGKKFKHLRDIIDSEESN